jgi:hypothetical protein
MISSMHHFFLPIEVHTARPFPQVRSISPFRVVQMRQMRPVSPQADIDCHYWIQFLLISLSYLLYHFIVFIQFYTWLLWWLMCFFWYIYIYCVVMSVLITTIITIGRYNRYKTNLGWWFWSLLSRTQVTETLHYVGSARHRSCTEFGETEPV